MADSRTGTPSPERLLSIIELQNAIIAAGLNADEVSNLVADRAGTLTSATGSTVALLEGDEIVHRAGSGTARSGVGTRVAKAQAAAARAITEGRPIRGEDASSDSLAVPLLYGENAVGYIEVTSPTPGTFGDADIETLRLLGQIIAIALHRAYTYPRPRYDSEHDALTGLGNRRAYDERIEAELARNRRYGHSFSLAFLELGGLETAIDRLGQAAGDEAVRDIATILKKHTRAIDGCFRIAAGAVAIVLPGTSLEGAAILVERCRAQIAKARPCDGAVVASFGVIEAIAGETSEMIAQRANAAVSADRASH
ncbi:MAG: sensor domain-containing diguanylate cyclase [Myxococcota bacterium]|nr:sensor domain-containing diguanylate cyclase [Myxococcota bacterium]